MWMYSDAGTDSLFNLLNLSIKKEAKSLHDSVESSSGDSNVGEFVRLSILMKKEMSVFVNDETNL